MREVDVNHTAWIDGAPAAFEVAVKEAARLLYASAAPTFAHIGADVEGAREVVRLAERIGGVLDHAASSALLADLDPIRESGAMLTTPLEAAVRADVVLIVGSYGGDIGWLARPARPHGEDIVRIVVSLGAPVSGAKVYDAGVGVERLAFLAALRARVKGRRVASSPPGIEPLAAALAAARFGVVLWSAVELESLAVEAIHGLVRDLNETTRFTTLAAAPPDHALGVQNVCGWMTGFPLRTGFALGRPEHDPWRFDARRLVAAGETDCLIWVSAFDGDAAPPKGATIALCAPGSPAAARISFATAKPGVESDAILFDSGVGAFVARPARAAAPAPSVAAILSAIRERLETC